MLFSGPLAGDLGGCRALLLRFLTWRLQVEESRTFWVPYTAARQSGAAVCPGMGLGLGLKQTRMKEPQTMMFPVLSGSAGRTVIHRPYRLKRDLAADTLRSCLGIAFLLRFELRNFERGAVNAFTSSSS